MKIKVKQLPYEEVMAIQKPKHLDPLRPNIIFRTLIRILSQSDLSKTGFTYKLHRMDEAGEGPFLILMNHSSFIDLKIASKVLYPKPFCIVCTSDGFVGKDWLMRHIGCIPTKKFVGDPTLISDMRCAVEKKKASVLMYPEASYSFDGCATPLPRHLGLLMKKLDVPVVTVITHGAFARDPLYNGLQNRKVKVSADVSCLFTREEVREKSVEELDEILDGAFSFDNWKWQFENKVEINEPFRSDGLNRILYKCAHCGIEGQLEGKGTLLTCHSCGKQYELTPLGKLRALEGETEFEHVPDWYKWERECVKNELLEGSYRLDVPVKIGVMVDYKAIYMVGEGQLRHDSEGFFLTGCDGKLEYSQKPLASYSLYSDYYWYEIGDVICIGDKDRLFYCFPQGGGDVVAKTRIAAEELYKLKKARRKRTERFAALSGEAAETSV